MKAPERRDWRRSGVFIVNFEQISHIVLIFLLLTLISKCWRIYFSNNLWDLFWLVNKDYTVSNDLIGIFYGFGCVISS